MEFTSRKLGRTEAHIPPVIWRFEGIVPSIDVLIAAEAAGANWIVIPHSTPLEALASLRDALADREVGWSFVIGVEMEALRPRGVTPFDEKLKALDLKHCAAVVIENPTSTGVKSGWPFHRLGQLRDRGATSLFFIDSFESANAEWIVEQTPAHAVIVPFTEQDQLAKYRLLKSASELGVAVIGKPTASSEQLMSDIRLRASEAGLTTQIVRMPRTLSELEDVFEPLQTPLSEQEREASWAAFCERMPEPEKAKGAHPPEFGG